MRRNRALMHSLNMIKIELWGSANSVGDKQMGGAMRSICFPAPTAAIVASCVAVLTGTAAHAQSVSATLLGVYKQASSNACTNSPTCRIDFSTVQQNLKVLRVSCTVDVQSNV